METYEKITTAAMVIIAGYNIFLYKKIDKDNKKSQQQMFIHNRELALLDVRKNTLNYIDILYETAQFWNNFFEGYDAKSNNLQNDLERMHYKTLATFDKSQKGISDLYSEIYLLFENHEISNEVIELRNQLRVLYDIYITNYKNWYKFLIVNQEKLGNIVFRDLSDMNKFFIENTEGMESYLQHSSNYYNNLYAVKIMILEEIKSKIELREIN